MKRKLYEVLKSWKGTPEKALLLRGPRQTGKTYLMKEFAKEYGSSLYLNLEDEPILRKIFEESRNADEIYTSLSVLKGFSVPKDGPAPLLMIDEIQSSEAAFSALKPLAIDGRCNILASGSLLGVLLNEKLLSPMGYVKMVHVGPMDFEEFLWALGTEEQVTAGIRAMISKESMPESVRKSVDRAFRSYMMVGGMPAAVSAFASSGDYGEVWERQGEIIEFARADVMKYAPNSLKIRILACFDAIPRILAKENKSFMYSEVEHLPGYGSREYDPALDWLIAAGLALRCRNLTQLAEPFAENESAKSFKIYLYDSGLLMRMYGREAAAAVASGDVYVNRGAVMESVTAQALVASGFGIRYYAKENSTRELDFVISYRDMITALEVKSGRKKHSTSLLMTLKEGGVKAAVKCADFKVETDENGVLHLPLFAPAFMGSDTDIVLDLPDISELNEMVRNADV